MTLRFQLLRYLYFLKDRFQNHTVAVHDNI